MLFLRCDFKQRTAEHKTMLSPAQPGSQLCRLGVASADCGGRIASHHEQLSFMADPSEPTSASRPGHRTKPVMLRWRLFVLAASGLVPLAIMVAIALAYLIRDRQEATQRSALALSRALATAVDAELRSTVAVLRALSQNDDLQRGGLQHFFDASAKVAQQQGWRSVVLADGGGRAVFRTRLPFGAADPRPVDPESMARALSTGHPVVGSVKKAQGSVPGLGFAVRLPVQVAGNRTYVLSAVLTTDQMLNVLKRQSVPANWVVGVLDQSGQRVARSIENASTRPSPSFQAMLDQARPEGTGLTRTVEGVEVHMQQLTHGQAEREALLRQVTQALGAAEEAGRIKDEFMAVLGHELRNPLAPISMALQLMSIKGDQATAQERRVIERQLAHMTRLVDDLLDLSRITGKRLAMRLAPVRLVEVLEHAAEVIRPLLDGRTLLIDIAGEAAGAWVSGDETRLAQVFHNLLGNALKFTAEDGEIVLAMALAGDAVEVKVRDNGAGMSAEVLSHAFEPFFQERQGQDRSRGGLGLGLAIVKSLVEMHGGSVAAHSEGPGRGAGLWCACRSFQRPQRWTPATTRNALPAVARCWWWTTTAMRPTSARPCCRSAAMKCAWRTRRRPPWHCWTASCQTSRCSTSDCRV
jgi:signal transduction histidine kinase